jgi:hypothetical protein
MHMTHEILCLPTHWVYSKNAEYYLLSEFIRFDLVNGHLDQYPKLLSSRKHTELHEFQQAIQ